MSRCSRFAAHSRCYALYAGARTIIRQRGGLVAKHGNPPAAAPLDLLHIACFGRHLCLRTAAQRCQNGGAPCLVSWPSAHRSCVWLDHVRFAAGAPLHAPSPKIATTQARPTNRPAKLSWNTAVSDTFFRLITTARLTLHSKQGCASAGRPISTYLPYR